MRKIHGRRFIWNHAVLIGNLNKAAFSVLGVESNFSNIFTMAYHTIVNIWVTRYASGNVDVLFQLILYSNYQSNCIELRGYTKTKVKFRLVKRPVWGDSNTSYAMFLYNYLVSFMQNPAFCFPCIAFKNYHCINTLWGRSKYLSCLLKRQTFNWDSSSNVVYSTIHM